MSFGCSVYPWCSLFPSSCILCSSTSDAQNVFANEARFQITRARANRAPGAYSREIRNGNAYSRFISREGRTRGVEDFMHALRGRRYSDMHIQNRRLANTVCSQLATTDTRGSLYPLSGYRPGRIPPKILPYNIYITHDDRL